MIDMKKSKTFFLILISTVILLISFLPLSTASSVYIYTNDYLDMPTYGTYFTFSENQIFSDVYRTAYSNSTFSEYWFITTTEGDIYGLHSPDANFNITDFFSTEYLNFTTSNAGTIYIYASDRVSPEAVDSGTLSNYESNLSTIVVDGAQDVCVSWRPTYTASLTSSAPAVYQGDTITFFLNITLRETSYTSYSVNITKDGTLFKTSFTGLSFMDIEENPQSHTYLITSLLLSDEVVSFSTTPLTMIWQLAPGGGSSSGDPPITTDPTPDPNATLDPNATPTIVPLPTSIIIPIDPIDVDVNIFVYIVIIIIALALTLTIEEERKKKKRRISTFDNSNKNKINKYDG